MVKKVAKLKRKPGSTRSKGSTAGNKDDSKQLKVLSARELGISAKSLGI